MSSASGKSREGERGSGRTPRVYPALDLISAGLILFVALATPWFYGTTEDWAVWTMNIACYALGAVLLTKLVVRKVCGYEVPRWEDETRGGAWFRRIFFLCNILVLVFCLIAAWNARATFILFEQRFEYHENYISWLPISYDSRMSWFVFWQYLGLFFFFWSLRDWLLGKSKRERRRVRRSEEEHPEEARGKRVPLLTDRLRWLLWVVCLNGMALAVVGLIQRLDGTTKLLWMRDSYWGVAESTFGPYSYRSNGAQYLNLIWPACIGFWWMLNEARRSLTGKPLRMGEGPHLILIPATIVMAVAAFSTLSRGGAFVASANFILIFLLLVLHGRTRWSTRVSLALVGGLMVLSAWSLGWDRLLVRLKAIEKEGWSERGELWENSKAIGEEFPVFGTGPGTFRSVYQMYRTEPGQTWQAFLHDDWLETRITFGYVGMGLVLLNLVLLPFAWFIPGKIETPFVLPAAVAVGLAGCLIHAKFDFPFQTYSVLFMFILLCGVLFCLSSRRGEAAG